LVGEEGQEFPAAHDLAGGSRSPDANRYGVDSDPGPGAARTPGPDRDRFLRRPGAVEADRAAHRRPGRADSLRRPVAVPPRLPRYDRAVVRDGAAGVLRSGAEPDQPGVPAGPVVRQPRG